MANLKFFKGTLEQVSLKNPAIGAIWFDTTTRLIKVRVANAGADTDWQAYSGLQNAAWVEATKQLQLIKADGTTITVDLSDVASAASLNALISRVDTAEGAIANKLNTADQVVKSVDTTADAGVALVHDTDGKLSVSVAEGDVVENNEAVVLGGQVYAAVKAAKEELAGQISGKNVSAEGDLYVSASADANKVTVAATTKLSDAVTKAESALQKADITSGTDNGTIAVEGTDVKVTGLQDAAYATVESLNLTAKGYADAVADAAKSYSIAAVTGEELAGLGTNVREAYKLVDEDSTKTGEYIKIYKDSALQSVVLNEDQELVFTYLLADGTESVVPVSVASFLAESEFGNGLLVNSETGVVSVKIDNTSDSFLTVSADGIKLTGVQSAINSANEAISGIDERVIALEDTQETVASALQARDITTGGVNGTISVKGTDVPVKGLGSAAYTEASAYATASQGTLADSALQSEDITEGAANGTIAVNGNDVAVHGLGTAAYTDSTAYDAAGAAANVLGTADDTADDITVYGVRAYASNLVTEGLSWAEFL